MVEPVFLKKIIPSVPSLAADQLVSAYHYLCRRGARKFWRSGLERSDLEQVAAIGLIKASRRYNEETRTPFEAYAWLMIVGELMHHVRDHERPIRLPRALRSLERRHTRAYDALLSRLGREPSDTELAAELGILVTEVRELRRTRETTMTADLDAADMRAAVAPTAVDAEDRLLVDAAFRTLSIDERRIIAGVYILGLTQLEVGRRLGISPKRVSRAHHGALARMKHAWVS